MRLTAELSLYPLQNDYIPVIQGFIDDLAAVPGLTLITNAMSTQVNGEFDQVFAAVRDVMARSVEAFGMQVLVCKFIASDLAITGH
jgi:uncharacterized protein YqgV (UPF0045/DUF77 family)